MSGAAACRERESQGLGYRCDAVAGRSALGLLGSWALATLGSGAGIFGLGRLDEPQTG